MKRIGTITLILAIAIAFFIGCEEDIGGPDPTGFELRFASLNMMEVIRDEGGTIRVDTIAIEQPTLTFTVWVFIVNDPDEYEYQGRASTDEPQFFSIAPGAYNLYARSNMQKTAEDTFFSWARRFSVNDGKTTFMTLYTDTTFTEL